MRKKEKQEENEMEGQRMDVFCVLIDALTRPSDVVLKIL